MSPTPGHPGNSPRVVERRPHSRWTPTSLVYVELGDGNGGFVVNISESGLAVQAAQVVHDHVLSSIRLKLPHSVHKIETGGQVAWRGETRKKLGIQFVDLPDAARSQIRQWISSEASLAASPQKINAIPHRKLGPVIVPMASESEDLASKPLAPHETAETRKQYPISFAMATALGGSETSVEVSAPPVEIASPPAVALAAPVEIESPPAVASSTPVEIESPPAVVAAPPAVACAPPVEIAPPPAVVAAPPVVIPAQPVAALPVAVRIPRPELVPKDRRPHPSSPTGAAAAVPGGTSWPKISPPPLRSSKLIEDSKSKLAVYPAADLMGLGAQRRPWASRAAIGVLLVIAAFAAGMAVGRRGLNQAVENLEKLSPSGKTADQSPASSAPAQIAVAGTPGPSSTANAPAQITVPSASLQLSTPRAAAQRSAPSSSAPAPKVSPDKGVTTPSPLVQASGAQGRVMENVPSQIVASLPAKPQGGGATSAAPPVAQAQVSAPIESSARTAGVAQQENRPLVPAPPKNPEGVTGSVATSSHFRSIRIPAEVRSQKSRLGDTLQIGQLISGDQPAYPPDAIRQRVDGTVKLHAIVGRDGAIQSVEPVSGPPLLVPPAMTTVRGWRYKPSFLGDLPIEREEDITLVFQLRNQPGPAN
ncbi:MAG TPA: energy transducer TonB [Candidatus Acidoferrum sp.]|nr:energy transducer TonB [Candidatus Acidoferrum sp.]